LWYVKQDRVSTIAHSVQAVYQSLLHLSWIDKLLDNIKVIFMDLYKDQLKKPNTSVVECEFDPYFDQQIRELEGSSAGATAQQVQITSEKDDEVDEAPPPVPGLLRPISRATNATSTDITPMTSPDTSRPSTPLLAAGSISKGTSRRAKKLASAASPSNASSGDESRKKGKTPKSATKSGRKWDHDGMPDEDGGAILDYSVTSPGGDDQELGVPDVEDINPDSFGTRSGKDFVLKDLDDKVHSILQNAGASKAIQTTDSKTGVVNSGLSAISGLFKNIVGGKVLTKADLEKPMKGMEEHLLNKNVAREAAVRLCEGVERELIGVKTGSFESIETAIRNAMESSLRKILTPTTSLDLLRSISAITQPSMLNPLAPPRRPYVISIVGVNGVGKSTNLSKLAYFLLQNDLRILIAACDTFRSGAVEQLRVHARNLKELSAREGRGSVELFEKGYGKDAANIAKDAVTYAASKGLDVVLIDTAGRRHNDTRLMSSLEKFADFARPDKIFMVGEALVGGDSVAQARNFNAAFGGKRGLDGFIISKCDTVGSMVGTLVSMVHATGIPVVFLGVGQHYPDLRTLSVGWAVSLLMS
jgi:signal recognition particle receptor subunit alpha